MIEVRGLAKSFGDLRVVDDAGFVARDGEVTGIAGMVLALAPVNARLGLAAIPTFGQTLLMGQLVRGESVSAIFIGVTAVATLAATALLLLLGLRLYERETILFPQ